MRDVFQLPEGGNMNLPDVIWCEDCKFFGHADMGGEGVCSTYEKETWYGCDASDCPFFKPMEDHDGK